MPVLRVEHTDNYCVISNKMSRDKDLSWKAKGALLYMLSCKDDWDFSVKAMASMSSDGYEATRSGLIELEKKGYLKREKIYRDGKVADVKYTAYEERQPFNFYEMRIKQKS